MALSEVQRSGCTVRRIETVGGDEVIRHVDELSDQELTAFLAGVDGGTVSAGSLTDGDVIVFTDYFRIERE